MSLDHHPRIGFETIGNATIIAYDSGPVLVTDPWITPSAYFGSWGHLCEIPSDQMQAIRDSRYVWFSHGHPDHLNHDSLPEFKGKTILLPDHVGGRIANALRMEGYDVQILPDRTWVELSPHVRVLCIADLNQDAVLLIDIHKHLLVNLNDAGNRGHEGFIRKVIKQYGDKTFLLALSGYGDADMINFFDEASGQPILPLAAKKFPVGASIAKKTESFGCRYFIPSSSMHRYQRTDSAWANQYATPLEAYKEGFESQACKLLPPFLQYDCENGQYRGLTPAPVEPKLYSPESFGDVWTECLDQSDITKVTHYFQRIEHLSTFLDFINMRVGGKDLIIPLAKQKFNRGLTFEVPRGSLMTSVEFEIFDDLLIGNFMKTTLHGEWSKSGLYPDFSPYVAKYADNGQAKTTAELEEYFKSYRRRAPLEYVRHTLEQRSKDVFRNYVPAESPLFQKAKRIYWDIKKYI